VCQLFLELTMEAAGASGRGRDCRTSPRSGPSSKYNQCWMVRHSAQQEPWNSGRGGLARLLKRAHVRLCPARQPMFTAWHGGYHWRRWMSPRNDCMNHLNRPTQQADMEIPTVEWWRQHTLTSVPDKSARGAGISVSKIKGGCTPRNLSEQLGCAPTWSTQRGRNFHRK